MADRLRLLMLEDDEADAELELKAIRNGGFDCQMKRVYSRGAFEAALAEGVWDLVLADYNLPAFTGLDALAMVRAKDPVMPFILISGTLGEERAIESLKAGASDYLIKDNLARLVPSIRRALAEHKERLQHIATQRALAESEERYRGIVEDQTELIVRLDPAHRILFANQAFARCHRVDLSRSTGAPFLDFVGDADRDAVTRALESLAQGPAIVECECRVAPGDGSEPRWQQWTFRGFFDRTPRLSQIQGVGRDITERVLMLETLKRMQDRLRQLSWRFLGTIESERKNLSRELHDEIGQILTGIRFNLEALARQVPDAKAQERIRDSIESAQLVLQRVRQVSHSLRPVQLDDLGLVAAVRLHLDRQASIGGFKPHFSASALEGRFAAEVETTCFRVAQESLTNVLRHSQAKNVWVRMEQEGEDDRAALLLSIRDDGKGFDSRAAGTGHAGGSLGLLGMEERVGLLGGTLQIRSEPGKGTEVRARIPLRETAAA
jgi:two-component system, NarL family, sensor histidine kinase UhpB